jgi:hypothetical protein
LTEKLASGVSRRRVVRGLGGGLLGALAAVAGSGRAWARGQVKVSLCHGTGTEEPAFIFVEVDELAVASLLAHGDFPTQGPSCPTRCKCATDADCPEGTVCGGCFCV